MTVKDTWTTGETFAASDENTIATQVNSNTTAEATDASNIASLESSEATDAANITSLQSEMTTAQSNVASLQSSRTTDESNISSLESSRTTDESNISSLESSRTTDEANISTLQAEVSTLGGGSVNLATGVTGVLPVAHGGTGVATATGLLVGNGTSAMATVAAPSGTVVGTSDAQTLTHKTVSGGVFDGYTEGVVAATATTTYTFNIAAATVFHLTVTGGDACACAMPAAAAGLSFIVEVDQPATGTLGTVTFTGVKWPGGIVPTLTQTLGACDVFSFFCINGTDWFGSPIQNYAY